MALSLFKPWNLRASGDEVVDQSAHLTRQEPPRRVYRVQLHRMTRTHCCPGRLTYPG